MSIEKVKAYLEPLGLAGRVLEFDVSSATVELAAAAIGTDGAHIAKSMGLKDADGAPVIVVTAGDRKIDNGKFKAQFQTKAKMLTFEEAHEQVGHDPGGVCPFALPDGVKSYLDVSLRRFDTVYPAAGSANSAVRLNCAELERAASNFGGWVDVCKPRE